MKRINISTKTHPNVFVLVDSSDFNWLNQWKWGLSTKGYAVRKENGHNITMSRLINQTPTGFMTDHINRNKLDNRRKNLRTVTASENQFNRNTQNNNKSGYKGVYKENYTRKWVAQIVINKMVKKWRFSSLTEAIKARKQGELQYAQTTQS